MAGWTWHDDGRVTIFKAGQAGEPEKAGKKKKPKKKRQPKGVTYRPRAFKGEELADLMGEMKRHLEVTIILAGARTNFMEGRAEKITQERAGEIVDSIDRAKAKGVALTLRVLGFYEPKGLAGNFGADIETMSKFADEALQRLAG